MIMRHDDDLDGDVQTQLAILGGKRMYWLVPGESGLESCTTFII